MVAKEKEWNAMGGVGNQSRRVRGNEEGKGYMIKMVLQTTTKGINHVYLSRS